MFVPDNENQFSERVQSLWFNIQVVLRAMEVEYFQGQIATNKSRHALVHFLEKRERAIRGWRGWCVGTRGGGNEMTDEMKTMVVGLKEGMKRIEMKLKNEK